jgi:hypothetical protein
VPQSRPGLAAIKNVLPSLLNDRGADNTNGWRESCLLRIAGLRIRVGDGSAYRNRIVRAGGTLRDLS